jgi:hypothetical protein
MYKSWSSSLCSLLQSPSTSFLRSKHFPQHPVLKHPHSVSDQCNTVSYIV